MMTMMEGIRYVLREQPELALFLALAIGYLLGQIRIGSFELGPAIGCLIAGVVVGQLGVVIPDVLSTTFFLLFLFSVGYKTGPQFFGGFGRNTLVQLILTLFFGVTGLMMTYGLAHFLRFNAGTAVGLLGGGFDSTEALGTGNDAIGKLALAQGVRRALMADAAVAFAVTDIVGLLTGVVLLARVAPWMMRVNLPEECRKLEEELGMETEEPGVVSAYRPISVRSYRLPESMDNKTVCDLENAFLPERVFVEKVKNAQGTVDAETNLRLHAGDLIVLSGRRKALGGSSNPLHRCETQDPELLDIPMIEVDYAVERKDLAHRTMGEIIDALGGGSTRGVFVSKLMRAGKELPFGSKVMLERGDVLTLIGAKHHVDLVAEQLGSVERPSNATDIVSLCVTLVIGGLVGFPVLHLSKINLGLGLPVGVLLASFVIGWLHSVKPSFGKLPGPVDWLLDSLGLTAFVAAIGINAGPSFVQGVRTDGLALLITGVVVCAVPYVLTVLVGRYILHVHPGILLGICAGSGTSSPALAAVQEVAQSQVPALSYGVSFAISSLVFAIWGSVIVVLMHVT